MSLRIVPVTLTLILVVGCVGDVTPNEENFTDDDQMAVANGYGYGKHRRPDAGPTAPDAATPAPAPDAALPAPAPDAAPTPTPTPTPTPDAAPPPAPAPDAAPPPPPPPPPSGTFVTDLTVQLTPQTGVSGIQRINFAVPLAPGRLTDETRIRVAVAGTEIAAARRGLARHPDGSLRSVQVQVDVDATTVRQLQIEVGRTVGSVGPTMTAVTSTLLVADGTQGPRVWALLPASWLASSEVVGPILPNAQLSGTPLGAWAGLCDYDRWNTDTFLAIQGTQGSWLYDRPTAMYRGYAASGAISPLRSGYREASIYRNGINVSGGVATTIAVPNTFADPKYNYSQGMAIHYLLTGDDRFREAAEAVAAHMAQIWPSPGYNGGSDFWTERDAGFALITYEWAAMISDDRAATFANLATQAVDAYLSLQNTYPIGYNDSSARCFAHSADAHGEPYGYFGCSPWMSAILADGHDAHARRVGGTRATTVRQALVKLGRIVARDGRDSTGKPFYWMGVGTTADEVDPYNEHWGESAYLVALAWHYSGRTDSGLRAAADALVSGLASKGEIGQLRSFNWQCRDALMTPYFLK